MIKKITIEIDTEEEDKRIFKFIRDFCIDNFRKYRLELIGTEFKDDFEWKEISSHS